MDELLQPLISGDRRALSRAITLIESTRPADRAAADALLEAIRRDRAWNDEAARKQLLKFFEAWGFDDPATLAARRKLSSLLFR